MQKHAAKYRYGLHDAARVRATCRQQCPRRAKYYRARAAADRQDERQGFGVIS